MSSLTVELLEEQTQAIAGLPYLSLRLSRDVVVAVQLKFVRETLVLDAGRFTQIPNVHSALMGLIEHRSNIFWVLDLPQFLGFVPLDSTAIETPIAILKIRDAFLGLGVHQIGRVLRFNEAEIVSPQEAPKLRTPIEIVPFLRGLVAQDESNLYVLDAEAIVNYKFTPAA